MALQSGPNFESIVSRICLCGLPGLMYLCNWSKVLHAVTGRTCGLLRLFRVMSSVSEQQGCFVSAHPP